MGAGWALARSTTTINGVLFVMGLLLTCASGDRIKVGGNVGWAPNVMNYTEWAAQQHFYVGDWLYFVFDKHYYNVLEVNETNYESCNDKEFVTNITRGGRDVFLLKEARPYYFISGGGYCWNKLKMAINVEQRPLAPPPLLPVAQSINGSPSLMPPSKPIVVFLVMVLVALSTFVFC
ncbi:unnamed protein product [Cuscuta epithymum]|uniref:Phytocyanin domain-containing protein n=1 Tax=Cuscuta epithymum TaxID=186058 RepID=A0AAV0D192_9ASTE|nr:unnamed protein product [Cuscuta epithymum]CAH9109463.1 unnamed protein product [Cuscuta epithymum]CAH9143625.1 unnamed protein product [Cuscuta epithymum]